MPYWWSSRAFWGVMPATSTVPRVAEVRSAMTRMRVLLPHPEGPIRETNSPLRTSILTSDRAVTSLAAPSLKIFQTPSAWTANSLT